VVLETFATSVRIFKTM